MKPRRAPRLRHRYSGHLSRPFWDAINSAKARSKEDIYTVGCDLQNLEEHILRLLKVEDKRR